MADSFTTLADGDGFSTNCGLEYNFGPDFSVANSKIDVTDSNDFEYRALSATDLAPYYWNLKGIKIDQEVGDSQNYTGFIGGLEWDDEQKIYEDFPIDTVEEDLLRNNNHFLDSDSILAPKSRSSTGPLIFNCVISTARLFLVSPSGSYSAIGALGHSGAVTISYNSSVQGFGYPIECLDRYYDNGVFKGFGFSTNNQNAAEGFAFIGGVESPFVEVVQTFQIVGSDTFDDDPVNPENNFDGFIQYVKKTESWSNCFDKSGDTSPTRRITDSSVQRSVIDAGFLVSYNYTYTDDTLSGWKCKKRTKLETVNGNSPLFLTELDEVKPEMLFYTY